MQFIIKTFGALDYLELHIGLVPGGSSRLVGHFTLRPEEQTALIGALRRGLGPFHQFALRRGPGSFPQFALVEKTPPTDEQAKVDAVFEEAIHQGASPEPITAAEPPPPSGREVIYQRPDDEGSGEHPLSAPIPIPDPVGRPDPASPRAEDYRTRRSCCASFVGDPHGYRCQCADEIPEYLKPGIDGSAQTVTIKNAQRGARIGAGEVSGPLPVSYQGDERFVAVCDVSSADPEYRWNAYDRETRRYRMPGFMMSEGAAMRTAARANKDPAEYASRYQWAG